MAKRTALQILLLAAASLSQATQAIQAAELIAPETEWRYFKGVTEASEPDTTAWRPVSFDDSTWLTGATPFFYELSSGYTGNTDLADMPGSYVCVFLRRAFNLANVDEVETLILDVQTDDGCLVWLNGEEIARLDMPEGEPTYETPATDAADEPLIATITIANRPGLLLPGANVLAVQAANASLGGSSDFYFNATLNSIVDSTPPAVEEVVPTPDATVRELPFIEVIFSENVTGVDAADLFINGVPATALEVLSPRDYSFTFAEPAEGPVAVTWAAGHGITDLSSKVYPFIGTGWAYTLDKTVPLADVIISEFLADNEGGIRDGDGDREDWIELYNRQAEAVDLDGWHLTDDAAELTKWQFSSVTIPAGGYLLVWASGKDPERPGGEPHTNFKLSGNGEFLALVDPNGNVVSAFSPTYPTQRDDVSYGRDLVEPGIVGFFLVPTPGRANAPSGPGFAPDPVLSLAGGLYVTNRLVIELSAPSGEIHYSINGAAPTESGLLYTGPIEITQGTILKARVFEAGLMPSRVVAAGYYLVFDDLAAFSSNLPLLVIQPFGSAIPQDSRVPVYVTAIEPFRGRTALLGTPSHTGMGSMEMRGQSSTGFAKKQYNLELNDAAGLDLEVPLLGLPAESDWVLNGPYSDKSLLNNFLAFELHDRMGHYAVRRRFVEVFLDQTRERLRYPTDYKGIYVLLEKIKIDNNRVDVARLGSANNSEPEITGGYVFKKDKDSPGDRNFGTRGGSGFSAQGLKYHDPKPDEITAAQQAWLRNYLIDFENALYAADWLSRTGGQHYSHFIDVPSFVDNHWIVEFAKQIDGYRLSNYFQKDRGGKVNMDPIWDWNLSFGNADYLDGWIPSGWYYQLINENQHIWLRRLISGTTSGYSQNGDPDFNQAIADRWSVLRTNILSGPNVVARVDEIAVYLDEAKDREFARWPRLNGYVWPNPGIYIQPTYARIIENKKKWIADRFNWIDRQFLQAPDFSRNGGPVPAGHRFTMSAPAGAIYYTLDGSDPRVSGGGMSPAAQPYNGPVQIAANARVVARAYQSGRWSGPTAATFVTDSPALAITEIMYHPAPPPVGDTNEVSNFEYLELRNLLPTPLNLGGYQFVEGIRFDFSFGTVESLPPGGRVVVVGNRTAFATRYGSLAAVTGEFTGNLDSGGETIRLVGPMGELVEEVRYRDGWYPATDGNGFALVSTHPDQVVAPANEASDWRTGSVVNGTPGESEPPAPALPHVLINEVLTHTDLPQVDAIELYNPAATPADISGWFLSDDPQEPKYQLPADSVVPANGFLVVDETGFNPGLGGANEFNLRSSGDEVFLFSADAEGNLSGHVHGHSFGAALNGVSFGRHLTSTGEEQFVSQMENTFGAANAGPRIGPVVISEIMYHPPDVAANGALWDAPENEYIELLNLTASAVPLSDPNATTNTWRLRDAVRYSLPMDEVLLAGERVLVVGFDPALEPAQAAAFKQLYNVPEATRLFGPWDGKLDNSGESVELIQPDQVRFYTNAPVTTAVLVDRVDYRDEAPWPAAADGTGFALQRTAETAFGNDPASWQARTPTPGAAPATGVAPTIQIAPVDQTTGSGREIVLSVLADGQGPLHYHWLKDGSLLPDTDAATLSLPAAQPFDAGAYQVVVSNDAGAVASPPAAVVVIPPGQDSDADGMTDLYEMTYGLDWLDPYDPARDLDGDGVTNNDESLAGTDAADPNSRLGFDGLQTGALVELSFTAAANRSYQVEWRSSLMGGDWSTLATIPVLDAGSVARRQVTVQDNARPQPSERYYRLTALQP